jgi:hypothetical protein
LTEFVAVPQNLSPFISVYPFEGGTFGLPVAPPAVPLPGGSAVVAFSPDGNYIAIGLNVAPYIAVYQWTGTAFGAKVTNPVAGLPSANVTAVAWSPDGAFVAFGEANSPFLHVWNWTPGVFGAKVTAPSGLTASVNAIAWRPQMNAIATASNTVGPTKSLNAWAWSPAGFGAKYADPSPDAGTVATGLRWTADGLRLAVTFNAAPFVAVHDWVPSGVDEGFGSRLTGPAEPLAGLGYDPDWSADETALLVGSTQPPHLAVYDVGAGIGDRFAPVGALGPGRGAAFVSGHVLGGSTNTPFLNGFTFNAATREFGPTAIFPSVPPASGVPTVLDVSGAVAANLSLTGTIFTADEALIRAGGATLDLSWLTSGEWDPTLGADNPITQALIDGLVSNGTGPNAWNAQVPPNLSFADVERLSAQVARVTLPPLDGYDINTDETITPTIPTSAYTGLAGLVVPSPVSFAVGALAGGGA